TAGVAPAVGARAPRGGPRDAERRAGSERLAGAHLGDEGLHDGVELAAVASCHGPLALVRRALLEDGPDAVELLGAARPRGRGLEPDEHLLDRVAHELLLAGGARDDDRVHAVARGAPLVLLREPRLQAGCLTALVEHGREVLDEALDHR